MMPAPEYGAALRLLAASKDSPYFLVLVRFSAKLYRKEFNTLLRDVRALPEVREVQ